MLSHLRTEAYPVYRGRVYPPADPPRPPEGAPSLSYEGNLALIGEAKRRSGR